ncbi:hypothetical protein [uncultured Clostridium sp.]|uniref:hypothetical protein n=1 Tax=uncultured Clostridium sp. TaxID=59620 RepID=UPI002630FDE7|nr:hypothetical protein [uncultured Clostridium sp.]
MRLIVENELEESNRIDDFRAKSEKRFFATISGFVDKSLFTKDSKYDEDAHKKYNERNTNSLQSKLKEMGLEYQKITGIWDNTSEKSFLVWNTAYTWEQFQQIMLKLNEIFKQWGICIGRKINDKYEINLWKTDDLDNISYKVVKNFTTISISDALKDSGTILTRKIYDNNNEIDPNKIKDSIIFEKLEKNICAASSECLMGAYIRRELIKSLLESK